MFCSLAFFPRLTRPNLLPRLARILKDHGLGGIAAVGDDLVVITPGPSQLFDAAITQGVQVIGIQPEAKGDRPPAIIC